MRKLYFFLLLLVAAGCSHVKVAPAPLFDNAPLASPCLAEHDTMQVILRDYAIKLAEAKDRMDELQLYFTVERIAKEVIAENRHLFKPLCANVDFYSGFVYDMLGIPEELYTPIFAISRISGWAAHRMEEIINNGKIIRPAYKYVGTHRPYRAMEDRPEE